MRAEAGKRIPKVGIIVLNYRNYEDTIRCLESLFLVNYPDCDIIVVDNDSRNDSLGHIRGHLEKSSRSSATIGADSIEESAGLDCRTLLLQSTRNGGYAAGNNLGIRASLARGAEHVVLLNNDTEVDPQFLGKLVEHVEANTSVGAAGPKVLNRDGRISRACARRRPNPWAYTFYYGLGRLAWPRNPWVRRYQYEGEYDFGEPKEVDLLSGCCMLIRAKVFQEIGFLDENTFLLQEEAILHERLRNAGWKTAIVPESVVVHKHGGSISKTPSAVIMRVQRESIRYYLMHYRKFGLLAAWIVSWSAQVPLGITKALLAIRNWVRDFHANGAGEEDVQS